MACISSTLAMSMMCMSCASLRGKIYEMRFVFNACKIRLPTHIEPRTRMDKSNIFRIGGAQRQINPSS